MSSEERKNRQSAKASSSKEGRYANFFQVGQNAFEFLIEFGQQHGEIHTRIYVSPRYARILSDLLLKALQQYELEFKRNDSSDRPLT